MNFVGLLGWDYQAAVEKAVEEQGGSLPVHLRRDNNSMFEVFTMPQLVNAFELGLVNRKRAAVSIDKLNFLNKQTLRRKANGLGEDSHLVDIGKSSAGSVKTVEEGRDSLILRYQSALKDLEVLKGW